MGTNIESLLSEPKRIGAIKILVVGAPLKEERKEEEISFRVE